MDSNNKDIAIDAVITWVDGSDVHWQSKINQYLEKKIDWKNKEDAIGYNSINEVDIAILSIIKYAKFIKNIYLVADEQQPENFEYLQQKAQKNNVNLKLIDHTVIFRDYKNYLPTFNSCSIITMLYQIPNLADKFIIFNDDTFLMRETAVSDFFIDGKPVIRGRWDAFYEHKFFRKIYIKIKSLFKKIAEKKTGYKLAQQKSAKLLGFKKYIRRDHTPVSVRKSTLVNYFTKNPKFLENNIKHKFKDNSQFIISSLSNHLEVKNNSYILENNFNLTYFQSYNYFKTKLKLRYFDIDKSKKFICFQSLDLAPKKTLKYIFTWIDKKLETHFNDTI